MSSSSSLTPSKKGLPHTLKTLDLSCDEKKKLLDGYYGQVKRFLTEKEDNRKHRDSREFAPLGYEGAQHYCDYCLQINYDRGLKIIDVIETCCPDCQDWIQENKHIYLLPTEAYQKVGIDKNQIREGLKGGR